ncbi:hypothetical protein ADUPG1_007214, partial [Aduncisulcus paluster]
MDKTPVDIINDFPVVVDDVTHYIAQFLYNYCHDKDVEFEARIGTLRKTTESMTFEEKELITENIRTSFAGKQISDTEETTRIQCEARSEAIICIDPDMKFSPLTHPDNPKSKDQFELDDDIDEQVRHYRFVPGVDEMSFRKIQRKLNRQRKASLHVWGKVDDIKKEMMERKKEKILLRKSQQSEADKKIKEEIDEGYEEEDYAKSEEEMRESPLSDVGFGGEEEEEQWGFFD